MRRGRRTLLPTRRYEFLARIALALALNSPRMEKVLSYLKDNEAKFWPLQYATMTSRFCTFILVIATVMPLSANAATALSRSLETIRAVGPEGKGNAEASAAWKNISNANSSALLPILQSMNGANELALNWLRAAVDTIAARELAAGRKLPVSDLERFLTDTKNNPQARRLAYELIVQANPGAADRLLSGMMDDPGRELRREAVQRKMDEALAARKAGQSNQAALKFQSILPSARDVDQVETIARQLKQLGQPVDLPRVFGWVSEWKVAGPFDSTKGAGFNKVYPPEQGIDLNAEYDGKNGKVRWQDVQARGDHGLVDLNKPCGALKEVAGYAYTEFHSDAARAVELRLGCKNAWKVWLNGKFLFGRDEYHRGMEIDQYRMAGELKPGQNTILVKVCQNELVEEWTKEWEFQLRVTDSLGAPIASVRK